MFDNKDIESYRNIKVPSDLKTKILADRRAESRGERVIGGSFPARHWTRSLSAVAACFLLVVAIFTVTRMNMAPVILSYEGTTLGEAHTAIQPTVAQSVQESRGVTPAGIPLSFKLRETVQITVSGGELYCVSENGEEVVSLGSDTRLSDSTTLWWAVLPGTASYELTVVAEGESTVYILELTDQAPNGVIYKK